MTMANRLSAKELFLWGRKYPTTSISFVLINLIDGKSWKNSKKLFLHAKKPPNFFSGIKYACKMNYDPVWISRKNSVKYHTLHCVYMWNHSSSLGVTFIFRIFSHKHPNGGRAFQKLKLLKFLLLHTFPKKTIYNKGFYLRWNEKKCQIVGILK